MPSLVFRFGANTWRARGPGGGGPNGVQGRASGRGQRAKLEVSKSVHKFFKKSSMIQRLGAKPPSSLGNFGYDLKTKMASSIVALSKIITAK